LVSLVGTWGRVYIKKFQSRPDPIPFYLLYGPQCDKIGRIFTHRVIIYYGQLFEIYITRLKFLYHFLQRKKLPTHHQFWQTNGL
jgi:hypothetical protein